MSFFQSSQESNYPFASKIPSKTSEKLLKLRISWTTGSHCTLMADSIRVAQPIRLQHLHQCTSRILLIYFRISHYFIRNYPVCLSVLKLPLRNMLGMRSVPNRNTRKQPFCFTFSREHRIWLFHVAVLERTLRKCFPH